MDMGVVALILSNEPRQLAESPYSYSRRVAPTVRPLTEGLQSRLRPRRHEPTEFGIIPSFFLLISTFVVVHRQSGGGPVGSSPAIAAASSSASSTAVDPEWDQVGSATPDTEGQ
jgi:hypothetical protein